VSMRADEQQPMEVGNKIFVDGGAVSWKSTRLMLGGGPPGPRPTPASASILSASTEPDQGVRRGRGVRPTLAREWHAAARKDAIAEGTDRFATLKGE